MTKWCRWLGHKWVPICIRKYDAFRFVGAYCKRCRFGKEDLLDACSKLKTETNTYNFKYWEWEKEK